MPVSISIPISNETIRALHVGDPVLLNGIIVTGRDTAHKWLYDRFIKKTKELTPQDKAVYKELKDLLRGGLIYHCGPVVSGLDSGDYKFVSAGPTTSIREEPYQSDIMRHFNLKGVIGKGGMGEKTLEACAQTPAVYFHAVGGAAALIARSVVKALRVFKLEFGVPEAMWVIQVKDFPVVVTMDSFGESLHKEVLENSQLILNRLIK
jgi:fumarate hydratase subunit beta